MCNFVCNIRPKSFFCVINQKLIKLFLLLFLFQGDLIGGIASDAFGRRRTLLAVCVIHMIFAYSAIFVRKYWLFVLVRLFIGGTAHAAWSILVSIHIVSCLLVFETCDFMLETPNIFVL